MSRSLTRALALPAAAIIALVPSGCRALEEAMLAHILRNQGRLQTFQGVLVETGVTSGSSLRSEVRFARPDKVFLKALGPDPYTGSTLVYADGSMTLYWPQVGYGVKIDGLPTIDAEGQRRLVADNFRHGLETYDVDFGESGHTAGRMTMALNYKAKRADTPLRRFSLHAYDKYSLFIAGEMHFAGGVNYDFAYDNIDFNAPIDPASFTLSLPPSTILNHWDLTGPNVPPSQAKEGANFPLSLPAPPPALLQTRIVRVDGPVPAYAVVYRSDPHFLLLTEYKDLGIHLDAADVGIPVAAGSHHGKLLLAPIISSYVFRENGVVYQLLGNVAFEDMLTFAKTL